MIEDQRQGVTNQHEFVRYIQRMVGRKIYYTPFCSCKWYGKVGTRAEAWAEWNDHRYREADLAGAREMIAGLKQALTGQEP